MAALKQTRRTVAAAAALHLPAHTVARPYGVNLDGIDAPTLIVYVTDVEPPSIACATDRAHLDVVVVSHLREPGTADDALDDLLDAAVAGLDTLRHASRGRAERVAYLDSWPAYRIPMEITT